MNKKYNNNIQNTWIEKYAPKTIDEIILDDIILNRINNIIHNNKMTNMIIMGMPGIGKSCVVNFLVKKLLGKYYKDGLLKLSINEKGLDNINDILTNFSKKLLKDENQKNINKIIMLEEADNYTEKSQIIINNIMETYNSVKFIFICNNINNIIENIQSKSIIFNFNYLDTLNKKILNRLKYILDNEKIEYDEDGLNNLILMSKGDIRCCINYLECLAYGYGEITDENIKKLYNQPENVIINDIINLCLKKDFKNCIEKLEVLLNNGYNTNDIIMFMIEHIKNINNISEGIKIKYLDILNMAYINVNENISSKLQLYNSIIKLIEVN
jgi:replication factor C subunit 2/4